MRCVVIGGGPAGRAAAMELAALDREVILVEKNLIGGTCLNEGCMVVCGLNDVARFLEEARRLSDLGVLDVECSADYRRIAGGVKRTLERIRRVTERETLDAGIEIMYGVAGFEDDELHVDGEEMDYDRLIIATGASPLIPPIEGAGNAITYRDILDLNRIPDKLVIIGGGVIAAEFAGIFSSLGSEVTVVSRSGFLSELDPLIREYVSEKILGDVRILEDTSTTEIEGSGVQTSEGYIEGLPLLATGLRPNSDFLKGFLELGPRGGVKVNDRMETSRENVYAAGDVTGGHGTTPVARMEGVVAGLNAAGVERRADYRYLPYSISLRYDVGFVDISGEGGREAVIPGLAGPGSFWSVNTGKTGLSKVRILDDGTPSAIYSVAPGARLIMPYLSLLMRLGVSMYEFEGFVETHPSTDSIYKLMRFLSRY